MLILGLLLVVLSAAAATLLIIDNTGGTEQAVTLFGRDLTSVTAMEAFAVGLGTAVVFMIGLWLVFGAGRRARKNRARYRAAREETKAVEAERDALAGQVRRDEEQLREQSAAVPPRQAADDADQPPAAEPTEPAEPAGARHAERRPIIKPGNSPTS